MKPFRIPSLAKILPICGLLLLVSCTIVSDVQSVSQPIEADTIYVQDQPNLHMEGFQPELLSQIHALGFDTVVFEGDTPEAAEYVLTFTANWYWDIAMYLTYFECNLYRNGEHVGSALYDAREGSSNLGKFGHTADKIRPLVQQLLRPE